MKKVFLTLLAAIVVVGALMGAGFWGYRMGYANGTTGSNGGPIIGRSYHMNPNQMPLHRFEGERFGRGFGFNHHPMMQPSGYNSFGLGYGYFSFFHLLWNVAILGLIVWFVYWLFTKSGWQITRQSNGQAKIKSSESESN